MLVVSKDKDYWNENMQDIATSWMARGGRSFPLSPEEQMAHVHLGGNRRWRLHKIIQLDKEAKSSGTKVNLVASCRGAQV